MTVFDLFSKRQKRLRGEVADVYFYDKVPNELRVQIVHIVQDTMGRSISYRGEVSVSDIYPLIHKALCREYGVFRLGADYEDDEQSVLNFFLKTKDIDKAIDIIEMLFRCIELIIIPDTNNYKSSHSVQQEPESAIEELNDRFKEHGFGFRFENSEIIRIDSTYIHSEIVKPVISLLNKPQFTGANEEYLKAHEHYRHDRNKECLTECLKAFESVMKIICKEKGWAFNETDPAKKLIQVCFQNGLVPTFTQNQFTSLQNLLESGIPTIRNKLGGHGQGSVPQKVDDEMTRYALNLTGTNIIFLIEQSGL